MGFTEFVKPDVNINFIKYRNIALILSFLIVVAAWALITLVGFNFGIEFAGGVELRVKVPQGVTTGQISDALNEKRRC